MNRNTNIFQQPKTIKSQQQTIKRKQATYLSSNWPIMSIPNNTNKESDTEIKRKREEEATNSSKVQITNYFKVIPKTSKSP